MEVLCVAVPSYIPSPTGTDCVLQSQWLQRSKVGVVERPTWFRPMARLAELVCHAHSAWTCRMRSLAAFSLRGFQQVK